ncbi:MAG: helix-turn-helix domain-containing protein [Myxococcales bacterium]|nr:helix-turn-helix domain-containing protein [Myxococcales bacterium]
MTSSPPQGRGEAHSTSSAAGTSEASERKSASVGPSRKAKERPEPTEANQLRKYREELCLSQAELARRANLSALTIARIEKGFGCRMSTKRKILEALGLSLADRKKVFGEEE